MALSLSRLHLFLAGSCISAEIFPLSFEAFTSRLVLLVTDNIANFDLIGAGDCVMFIYCVHVEVTANFERMRWLTLSLDHALMGQLM